MRIQVLLKPNIEINVDGKAIQSHYFETKRNPFLGKELDPYWNVTQSCIIISLGNFSLVLRQWQETIETLHRPNVEKNPIGKNNPTSFLLKKIEKKVNPCPRVKCPLETNETWTTRLASAKFLAKSNISDKFLYLSVTQDNFP